MIETKRKSQMIHIFPISQQFRWGNGEPGKLQPSYLVTQKWYLIIPISIYCASNLEARIVYLNTIQNITIKQHLRPASTSAHWTQIPTHHPYTLRHIITLTFPIQGGVFPACCILLSGSTWMFPILLSLSRW